MLTAVLGIAGGGLESAELADYTRYVGYLSAAVLLGGIFWLISSRRSKSTSSLSMASQATDELTDVRLPALFGSLGTVGAKTPEFIEFDLGSSDDHVKLSQALNRLQATSIELAEGQQASLQSGIGQLVTNMARRSQSLIDRQLDIIDRLEAAEEDPHRLEELFSLDHLATRMRRNAESLLVLAGADSTRRRGGPVAMVDVLRVAMGEIEDYRHITMDSVDEQLLPAQIALDLAHVLSELLENAAQFSPPTSPVHVCGTTHPSGSYLISISDQGIGMVEDQLEKANSTLSSPPALGLGMTRSLGFVVVGRLAQRLGIRVELATPPGDGLTAIVELPKAAIAGGSAQDSDPSTPDHGTLDHSTPDLDTAISTDATLSDLASSPVADRSETSTTQPDMPLVAADPVMLAKTAAALLLEQTPMGAAGPGVSPTAPSATGPSKSEVPAESEPSSDALTRLLGLLPPEDAAAAQAARSQSASPTNAGLAQPVIAPEPAEDQRSPLADQGPPSWADRSAQQPPENHPSAEPAEQPIAELSAETSAWVPPVFDEALLGDVVLGTTDGDPIQQRNPTAVPEPTNRLLDAIPSADSFDSDVADLLNGRGGTTESGLKRRSRGDSQVAPPSEGRPVAASSRSPEEIRSMLARYRSGLSGTAPEGNVESGQGDHAMTDPYASPPLDQTQNVIRPPAPRPHHAPRTQTPETQPPETQTPQAHGARAHPSQSPFTEPAAAEPAPSFQTNPFDEDPFDSNPFGTQS